MTLEKFLVSFLVDARGGSMRSSRYSGLRILVPPSAASAPTRITCRMQRADRVPHPPQLNDGDGLACRILEMGPHSCKFNSPVMLEIPHYASLRNREREIIILRSDNGETWKEHTLEATEQAVHDALGASFDTLESTEELTSRRIVRILTSDFPQYFALVSRLRQETTMIGAQGGVISSTVVTQVQAVFPENALQKRIRVGLQAHPIYPEAVLKLLGNRVAVSPIVTVEPRRRKFHKPITLTIPLPRMASNNKDMQASSANLRLLCSITGGVTPAHWEDITGSTPLSRVKDCISFTTTVSARFWLMDCQNVAKSGEMADLLYRESIFTPYMGKFVLFSKRSDTEEVAIRCFCITDDKVDKTLECQEGFELRAASPEVEVLQGRDNWLEFGSGNLVPMAKHNDQLHLHFEAFRENRLAFFVRLKDISQDPIGKIAFMKESRQTLGNDVIASSSLVRPLCALEVRVPISIAGACLTQSVDHSDHTRENEHRKLLQDYPENGSSQTRVDHSRTPLKQEDWNRINSNDITVHSNTIARSELDLMEVACQVDSDWPVLATELGISKQAAHDIKEEFKCDRDRAHAVLMQWRHNFQDSATGNELDRALRRIGREDVIKHCMRNITPVTKAEEFAEAEKEIGECSRDQLKRSFSQKEVELNYITSPSAGDGDKEFEDFLDDAGVEHGHTEDDTESGLHKEPEHQEQHHDHAPAAPTNVNSSSRTESIASLQQVAQTLLDFDHTEGESSHHGKDSSLEEEEEIQPVIDESRRAPSHKTQLSEEEKSAAYDELISKLNELSPEEEEEMHFEHSDDSSVPENEEIIEASIHSPRERNPIALDLMDEINQSLSEHHQPPPTEEENDTLEHPHS